MPNFKATVEVDFEVFCTCGAGLCGQSEGLQSHIRNEPENIRAPQYHKVKSQAPHFVAVLDGTKTFEIRENDRDYQTGDIIVHEEWDRETGYSGRTTVHRIGYITTYAQTPGWVVFSLLPLKDKT
jgi:hypothetical protein